MRLSEAFASRLVRGKAFIPFIMGGDPDLDTTTDLIVTLAECGATAIEVGVPFSDPIADGATIQRAAERALSRGTTVDAVLTACAEARQYTDVPVILFSYVNPILRFGVARLAERAAACGVAAVLFTDVPVEHSGLYAQALSPAGVEIIQMVAPTSYDERLKKIAACAEGFIYAVSRTGVTGEQQELSGEATELVARMRCFSDLPVLLGFGISSGKHFLQACAIADGAIIGSALVNIIASDEAAPAMLRRVRDWVEQLTSQDCASLVEPDFK
ncbi:MAG: tryptophan synthase subunit alpha [Terriglobales bacterium]